MNILNRGYWVTTLLSVVGLAFVDQPDDADDRQRRPNGIPPGSGSSSPASSASPPASPSSTSRSSTRPARSARCGRSPRPRKTGPATNIISGTAVGFETTAVTAITIGIALIASHWLGAQADLVNAERRERRRHLRHRRRDHGHAHDHGLHPGHGHLRPDHRQRRRHRRVLAGRGRRPRDHRQARRRGQHHQGAHQGLRDRLRLPGRVPALLGLHRQGQPDPRQPDRGRRARRRAAHVGQPGRRRRLRRRLHRRHARLPLQHPRHPRRRQDRPSIIVEVRRQFREMPGIMDYTQRPDYARVVDITTKRRPPRDDRPGPRGRRRPRSSSASSSATRPWRAS